MRTVLLPETRLICVQAWRYLHCVFRNLTRGTCKLTVWKGFHWLQLILDLWCFFLSTTGSESQGAEVLMISFYPISSAKPLKPGSSFLSLGTEASKHWSGMQGSPHFRCGLGQVVLKTEIRSTCSEWVNVSLKPVTKRRLCHLPNMSTFSRLKSDVSNPACPSSNLLLFLLFVNKPFSQPTSLR